MAFVLVQHLSPMHESRLSELLGKVTALPVHEAADDMAVEVDNVYVIPPNASLRVMGGKLRVTPRPEAPASYLPIDTLFRSLAEDQRSRAIGVILSGSGSDGTLGLCEIKAVGGITFVQDEKSAAHAGMPVSARESGCADFILPPAGIAEHLARMSDHPYLSEPDKHDDETAPADRGIRRILARIRRLTGVDFQLYRRTSIERRIMRRMALRSMQSLAEYEKVLEGDSQEVIDLYHDLLINVTSFFRDPEVFEALKTVVFPELARRKPPSRPYRVWVAGCSTGQEAYSLAIVLLEFFDTLPNRPALQIFATDLSDQTALDKARAGVFPSTIEGEVSAERLRRFFRKEDHTYRIDKSIRDMCVFARQNVAADPPFSHLDLISCRNVLIYLSSPLQNRVMPTFHYALDVPGFLVLGSAESVGEHGDLFELVDREHKIYEKKPVAFRHATHVSGDEAWNPSGSSFMRTLTRATPNDLQKEADRILLGRFSPPAVLVTPGLEIVQFRGKTSPYLEAPSGEPTSNILKLAREGLFLELRSALAEAAKRGKTVHRKDVRVLSDDGPREVALEVVPVKTGDGGDNCFLVVFHDAQAVAMTAAQPSGDAESLPPSGKSRASTAKREAERLRQELAATREYLQSLAEQQDAANEELRSANEEILSSNEELQSTNEELETAKEELQSTNEELNTVNDQLQHRNAELTELNNDLTNLLSSTNLPVVMVGSDSRIRRFTAAAKRLLGLVPADNGRPIGEIRAVSEIVDVDTMIADAVTHVRTTERGITGADGHWYTLRVAPYRTHDNKIDGAVVLFVEAEQLRRRQSELQEKNTALREQGTLLEMSKDAIVVRDAEHRILFWSHGAEEVYGYTAEQARGRRCHELLQTDPEAWRALIVGLSESGAWEGELDQRRSDGTRITVFVREILLHEDNGTKPKILSIKRDITEDKRLVAALRHADRQKDLFLATLAHELRNPIAPMKNAVEIMRLAGDNSATMDQVRDMLDRQVRQLAGIVDDLIDVTRIIERKIELRLEPVAIDAVVRVAVETSRTLIESRGHKFSMDVPDETLYVEADAVRLSQVLVNLLNNASKFTPAGGKIALIVRSEGTGDSREVVIRVRDNGIGIENAMKARIFDMFEQGHASPEHGSSGLGVGLTLVRSLAQMHRGTIDVHSDGPGKGSEFVLRLPQLDAAKAIETRKEAEATRATAERILIVDDNLDQAESLGKVLQLLGHEIRLSFDGEDALRAAADFQPGVVLLDLGLPKRSGYEVAQELRADPNLKNVLLIAQTGWGQDQDRRRTREAGFDHHLVKPVDVLQVQRILSMPRHARQEAH
jgi:two-component system CheB/CheR fusion protein